MSEGRPASRPSSRPSSRRASVTFQDANATLAAQAGVTGRVMTEEERQERLAEQMHRMRHYHFGNHFVLNQRRSAMYCLKGKSEVRRKLFNLIDSTAFTVFIALCIAVNCIMTILDTPKLRDLSGITTTVFAFDIIFQVVFTIEMALKFLALGVVMHRHSFFRSPQNTIDFIVVVVGFAVFFFDQEETTRLTRLVRSMRAVGYLTRVALLKSIFVSLTRSFKKLRDIMLLMSFVIVGMAVLGLQVFVGTFQQKCAIDVNVTGSNATTRMLDPAVSDMRCSVNPNSGHECSNPGAVCVKDKSLFESRYITFDHIGDATLVVFKTVTMDNWPADLKVIQEANGVTYFLYSFTIVLFGAFFAMNLVLAILSEEYEEVTEEQEERAKRDKETREAIIKARGQDESSGFLISLHAISTQLKTLAMNEGETATALDRELQDDSRSQSSKMGDNAGHDKEGPADRDAAATEEEEGAPEAPPKAEHSAFFKFRRAMWRNCVNRNWFKNLSLAVTVINILVLATDHWGMDKTWETVNNWINFGCSIYFIIEAVVKIVTMLDKYFRDPFNDFDLLLCIISIPEMVLSGTGSGSSLSALRAFRLARLMRVINSSPHVKRLLITVGNSAKAASFLFFFMFIFIVLSAAFCVIVFPDAVPQETRPNYVDFPNAVLTMFIVISGENWVDEAVKVMLGTSAWAIAFFIPYFLFGNYVILNFVVVILIASYNDAAETLIEEEDREAERLRAENELNALSVNRPRADSPMSAPGSEMADPPEQHGDTTPEQQRGIDDEAPADNDDGAPADHGMAASRDPPKEVVNVASENASRDPASPNEGAASNGERAQSAPRTPYGEDEPREFVPPPEQRVAFDDDEGPGLGGERKRRASLPGDDTFMAMKFRNMRNFSCRLCLADLFGMPKDPDAVLERLEGRSLKIFSSENVFRRFCARVVSHPYFELLVIIVVIQSCIALAMDNNEAREDADFARLLDFNSIFLVVFFIIECALKWVAFGVGIGEYAYFKDPWNRLDFVILIVSIAALFLPLHAVQSLRVFRLASKWSSMRVVITSLVQAIPGIANVFFLTAFFFLVAGIIGVQVFKGRFASCNDESIDVRQQCVGQYNTSSAIIVSRNGSHFLSSETTTEERHWLFSFYNFNNLGQAALSLTVITYGDGWSGILYNAMDVRDNADFALKPNDSWWWAPFIVLLLVIGNFFLNNLFVGSLTDSFGTERKRATGAIDDDDRPLLTDEQERWIREYRFAAASRLPLLVPKPEFAVRRFFAWVYYADYKTTRLNARAGFDAVITLLILANAIILCTTHDGQPEYWDRAQFVFNVFFAVAFTIEFIIKVIAMRPHAYYDDPWNCFDFLILVAAWLGIAFSGVPGTNALRVARVARVLRLVKKARGLYRLFQTLIFALPQLVNVSIFLLLVLFIFGVTGTQLFQELYFDDSDDTALGRFFNFRSAWRSMMLLFQIGTGEAWADVLEASMIDPTNSGCTYEAGNCGTAWAYPFYILFMLCANSVAVNLFTYIVVENYLEVNQISDRMSQYLLHRIDRFRRIWVTADPERDGLIRWDVFVAIVRQMQVTADTEWDEFMAEWGDDEIMDLDGDGVEDDSASEGPGSDMDDEEDEEYAGVNGSKREKKVDLRPTTADFRNVGVMKALHKALGQRDFDATRAAADDFKSAVRGPRLADLRDTYFLSKVRAMRVPVGEGGMVYYDDCLNGIVREFYGIDDVTKVADEDDEEEFAKVQKIDSKLREMVDYDPHRVFMVHHALAAVKISRAFRGHVKREVEKSTVSGGKLTGRETDVLGPAGGAEAGASEVPDQNAESGDMVPKQPPEQEDGPVSP